MTTSEKIQHWRGLAQQLRADAIRCTTAAGSGHPTSAMSAADLMAVLMASHLRYDIANPRHPANDRLIFSKGHAAPLLYAMLRAMDAISDEQLLSLRKLGSPIEGHPSTRLPYVDAATGSLGQGLAIGVGIALGAQHLDGLSFPVWVLLGDSELAEGSNYEAFAAAAHYQLRNLIAIVDVNRLGQTGETALGWDLQAYQQRIAGFGWDAIVVDGHDPAAIDAVYDSARHSAKPTCILAKTVKGQGVSFTANADGWHGRALTPEEAGRAYAELAAPARLTVLPAAVHEALAAEAPLSTSGALEVAYHPGDEVATREGFGAGLVQLGDVRGDVVVVDAEVGNSTGVESFEHAHPERFFEAFIAEQLMVGMAQGLSIPRRRVVFCSTFAAFLGRAHDQIRMAAVSRCDLRLCGSHSGISIGEDGPSQMAIDDLARMRAIPGSVVLYPADGVAAMRLTHEMANLSGVSYLRTTRAKTPVIYEADEQFPVGGSKVVRSSERDVATVFAAGITLHQARSAAERLSARGVAVRVVDLYSVKPLDAAGVRAAAAATGKVVVVEDHAPAGGLGEAVLGALAQDAERFPRFTHLAVRDLPGSGKPQQLLDAVGIGANGIIAAIEALIAQPAPKAKAAAGGAMSIE